MLDEVTWVAQRDAVKGGCVARMTTVVEFEIELTAADLASVFATNKDFVADGATKLTPVDRGHHYLLSVPFP
jgi:hypothetical protein